MLVMAVVFPVDYQVYICVLFHFLFSFLYYVSPTDLILHNHSPCASYFVQSRSRVSYFQAPIYMNKFVMISVELYKVSIGIVMLTTVMYSRIN